MLIELKRMIKGQEFVPQNAKEVEFESLPKKVQDSIDTSLHFLRNNHEQWFSGGTDVVNRCFDLGGGSYKIFIKFEEPDHKKRKLYPTIVTEMIIDSEGKYKNRRLGSFETRRYLKKYDASDLSPS